MEPAQYCIESKGNIVKYIHDVWPSKAYPYVEGAYDSKYLGFKREPWDDLAIKSTLFTIAAVPITREKFRVKRTSGSLEDSDLFSFGIHTLNIKPGNFGRFDTFKRDEMKLGHKTIPNFETYPLEIATDLYNYIDTLESFVKEGVFAPISPEVFNIFSVFNKVVKEVPDNFKPLLDESYKHAALGGLKDLFDDYRIIY